MTDDLLARVSAVHRELSPTDADGARTVLVRRNYPHPIDDVWNACITPERLARWLGPVSGDLRLGGRFHLEGNASGDIVTCQAPTALAVTWEFGGETSSVQVTLAPEGDGTRFEIAHTAVPPKEFWDAYGPGAVGIGWDLSLIGLEWHLDGVEKPDEVEWTNSAQGTGAITAAAAGWVDAQMAAGDDRATAERAAAGSRSFYLGTSDVDPHASSSATT